MSDNEKQARDCQRIEPLLIDFSDGALLEQERRLVATHVQQCAACRGQLLRLERSLQLAGEVWRQSEQVAAATDRRQRESATHEWRWWQVAAPAAVVLVVVALLLARAWQSTKHDTDIAEQQTSPPASVQKPEHNNSTQSDLIATDDQQRRAVDQDLASAGQDVELIVRRAARRARLVAATEVLAEQPQLENVHQQAVRYVSQVFGN